jgi:DNA-binding NtrC family response regulator
MATRDTILVVEDDPDLAAALGEALGDAGVRVLTTTSVAGAMRILRAFRVQLVLTDALWQDRATDPWASVDAIRAAAGDAPLILCSGHDAARYAECAAHGCAAFLAKPFDIDAFIGLVVSLLPGDRGGAPRAMATRWSRSSKSNGF